MFLPLHRWIWSDKQRSARKLFSFADTEADGGGDLVRAAELTDDPTLRGLYVRHALDEDRHAHLFRAHGLALRRVTCIPTRARPTPSRRLSRRACGPAWMASVNAPS